MEDLIKQMAKDLSEFRQDFTHFKADMHEIKGGMLEFRGEMLEFKGDMLEFKTETMSRFKELTLKINESHGWIRTMLERQDVQKAETDNMKYRMAVVEGALQGAASSFEKVKQAR